MIFKIVYGNHGDSGIHVSDTLFLIKSALESCGHKADLERNMCPGHINILIENFTYDFIEVLKEFHSVPGTEFIVVATEFITGQLFNDFDSISDRSEHHYNDFRMWRKRYKTFMEVAKYATAVWHLSDTQIEAYRDRVGEEKVFYLPHGYIKQLERIYQKPMEHKDIDVIFTGTRTPYRGQVLNELEQAGLKVTVLPISTIGYLRDDYVARAKVAVNIKQNAEWKFPSNSRYHYHLINRSMMVSESCEIECDLTKFVLSTEMSKLAQTCLQLIEQKSYQEEADRRYSEFKESMPMQPLMEKLLEDSFSVNG